jgi:hypothetical protein
MADLVKYAEQIHRQAGEVMESTAVFMHSENQQSNQITRLKDKLIDAITTLQTAEGMAGTDTTREKNISDARVGFVQKVDDIVQEIDVFTNMVQKVAGSTRTLRTLANQLKYDVDPSDDAKKQTDEDRRAMLVEARNALRKGILTEEFADLKAGVTPRDFAGVTYVYLSQSWRAYNTDDAMNSALVAAMMIGVNDPSGETLAGDVYQPYLMDTLEHRRAIMRFMGDKDSAGEAAVDQVDMQWREHFTSSAAQEAQRGADEIRQLKIRLADTEAELRNAQNNVFDLAMKMAAKIQAAQQKK